jgi:hypothetical protein
VTFFGSLKSGEGTKGSPDVNEISNMSKEWNRKGCQTEGFIQRYTYKYTAKDVTT